MQNRPIIGITMGDPASIGPEIALKALLDPAIYSICRPLLVGDAGVFNHIAKRLALDITLNAITDVRDAKFEFGKPDIFDLKNVDIDQLQFGQISAMCGNASFEAVKK